jgi:hypothetical protein
MEISMDVLQKTKLELPYDPTIPLLGIFPKEYKSTYSIDTCTLMCIGALFIPAKLWTQTSNL